jgi:hypothetical protein
MIGNDELLTMIAPSQSALHRLREYFAVSSDRADIYLAYVGTPPVLSGFLVAAKGSIDQVIAYCPMTAGTRITSDEWRREVLHQLRIAIRVAEDPLMSREDIDIVWLGQAANGTEEIPNWVYGLTCLPLTYPSDEKLISPRPFCPTMFERMASQPQAIRWLVRKQSLSLQATDDLE